MTGRRPSLFDYLADAEERPLLVQALSRTLTDAERLHYASVIEPRDPARAEWLRLACALHSQAAVDPATRRRFDALGALVADDWVRLMSRSTVLNCGKARGEPRRVRFTFVCERRRESLAPTGDAQIRACDDCQERVHRCATAGEAEAHARAGRCIAVSRALVEQVEGYDSRYITGRPDPIGHWAGRIFGDE